MRLLPVLFDPSSKGLMISIWLLLSLQACQQTEHLKDFPKVSDKNLSLELIDSDPSIMTPIGLTIDQEDKLYLLESHTHTPEKSYAGPAFDRIKKGIDQDGDGRPESWFIFADSITDGMNLESGPDNTIYLACKDRILAFKDHDGDGQSDHLDTLLIMRASGDIYDHAGILGLTFSPDGWLFISRGNTGGLAWEMEGSDGSTANGYGDGGNVVRCKPDGTELEEVATGFWNPFDLKYSQEGRLLLIDNDPDSRGPNRLVEIVDGGDYGYKSLYGGSGIHPFLAWDGDLPGTLPYAAALGEAPSGMIDAGFSNFGERYQGDILATIWEENSLVRVPMNPRGSSLSGTSEILVKGDSSFHPVALAANSKGDVYFTDWVVRQYPNHGKGRLWRLSSLNGASILQRRKIAGEPGPQKGGSFLNRNLMARNKASLLNALETGDVFIQAVARKRLRNADLSKEIWPLLTNEDPKIRLQGVLCLFGADLRPKAGLLQNLLTDKDEGIRQMTLIYLALNSRTDLYEDIEKTVQDGLITPSLFETYLAVIRHLQPSFMESYQSRSKRSSKQIERSLPPGFLRNLIQNEALPSEIRAAALPFLNIKKSDEAWLLQLLKSGGSSIQEILLQMLTRRSLPDASAIILGIIKDPNTTPSLKTLALLSLSYQNGNFCQEIASLLMKADPIFQEVALRYLCRCSEEESIQVSVNNYLQQNKKQEEREAALQLWQLGQGNTESLDRPDSAEGWLKLAGRPGDPERGRWVFHARKAQCQNCHKINAWGSDFGPDLSHIGSSKSAEQLITAILQPSKEISPEWQGWYITDKEGRTHYGRQIDVGFKNAEIQLPSGEFVTFKNPQSYGMAPSSLMPKGLEQALSIYEFKDLIAYLVSLK